MCGSYSSSKTTLLGLNVIYFVVSLIMIGIAVNGEKQILNPNSLKVKITLFSAKVSGLVTSLPIIGGITASGVFLLFLTVIGIIGLMKNHQVMLYVYMIILFFIFIIQFSCSCAALAASDKDQLHIIHNVRRDLRVNILYSLSARAGTQPSKPLRIWWSRPRRPSTAADLELMMISNSTPMLQRTRQYGLRRTMLSTSQAPIVTTTQQTRARLASKVSTER